ncbi:MAG: XshC-Cox1-family protein, partial [Proteobacteria bacterium]|nr:XshC-Cox1-family protein [Pseudomonadota bacterium]
RPDIFQLQSQLREGEMPHALATVVEVLGSSSAAVGSKALFDAQGQLLGGWVGGGCAQSLTAQAALDCLRDGKPRLIDIDLNDEVFGAGMPCGGNMRVFVEPVLPRPKLWLTGRGRIVETLCDFASRLDFDVIVIDALATPERFPGARRLIGDDGRYGRLQPATEDFVVVASHHKGDYESLSRALASGARYVALVASRKRAQLVLRRLAQEGLPEAQLRRVHAPAGLDLGGELPEEIALSVISEIVLERRSGKGIPLGSSFAAGSQADSRLSPACDCS